MDNNMDTSHVLDMFPENNRLSQIHVAYLAFGLLILVFGYFSLLIKNKLFLTEAFVSTGFGILIGPYLLDIFDLERYFGRDQLHIILLEISRMILGIQCLAAGIKSPGNFVNRQKLSLAILLGPVMVLKWVISSLILKLVLGCSWELAFMIGGCVTPTDPVLSNGIVQGRFAEQHIPDVLRGLISAESAANDGLGLPFVFLVVYLQFSPSVGDAIGFWFLKVFLYSIVGSVVLGIIIGTAARMTLQQSQSRNWIDKESLLTFSISLSLLTIGLFSRLGLDEILGCFVVGLTVSWDHWLNEQIDQSDIQDVLDTILNVSYFVFLGAILPFADFGGVIPLWQLIVSSLLLMVFRRLPFVLMFKNYMPAVSNFKEAVFLGWFGPIGAGAVFYAMLSVDSLGQDSAVVPTVVLFVVLTSIIVHGASVGVFHIGLTFDKTVKFHRNVVSVITNEGQEHVAGVDLVLKDDMGCERQVHMAINDSPEIMQTTRTPQNIVVEIDGIHLEIHERDSLKSLK